MYEELTCFKCDTQLEQRKTEFEYLGQNFFTELMCCPVCGQVFIPEELVRNKIADVEKLLEEK